MSSLQGKSISLIGAIVGIASIVSNSAVAQSQTLPHSIMIPDTYEICEKGDAHSCAQALAHYARQFHENKTAGLQRASSDATF
jgi:hypothetical protein